ncbi:MAG: hypothetical protein A2506_03765 [Elusimicrobia bacterium RIFOXYD12_FULL_66_9]|nr:MAG: hypothetical protein A2506_03765 [Elusimicrobia bacterium RIFOXYD12_FULL_66_9]
MSDEERMPDDLDPRLLRAMKAALIASAPPMPSDLKAELKRMARARAPRPSWLELLRQSLSARPWAYGAGAAFAAAGLMIMLRLSSAPSPATDPVTGPVARVVPVSAPPLADLWTDDDGGDEDEG